MYCKYVSVIYKAREIIIIKKFKIMNIFVKKKKQNNNLKFLSFVFIYICFRGNKTPRVISIIIFNYYYY